MSWPDQFVTFGKWRVTGPRPDQRGFVGTYDDCMTIVQNQADAVDCKLEIVANRGTFFATARSPQDRWLGVTDQWYAGWYLSPGDEATAGFRDIGYDQAVGRFMLGPEHVLYGPYVYNGTPYVCWSKAGEGRADILSFKPLGL